MPVLVFPYLPPIQGKSKGSGVLRSGMSQGLRCACVAHQHATAGQRGSREPSGCHIQEPGWASPQHPTPPFLSFSPPSLPWLCPYLFPYPPFSLPPSFFACLFLSLSFPSRLALFSAPFHSAFPCQPYKPASPCCSCPTPCSSVLLLPFSPSRALLAQGGSGVLHLTASLLPACSVKAQCVQRLLLEHGKGLGLCRARAGWAWVRARESVCVRRAQRMAPERARLGAHTFVATGFPLPRVEAGVSAWPPRCSMCREAYYRGRAPILEGLVCV